MALPANTKSTNTTETVRGEHQFDIDGYYGKLRAGRRSGRVRVLTSDTFAVGGLDWAICYHLFADMDDEEDYVSMFVRLVTPNASAQALYDLRLVDAATGLPRSVYRSKKLVAFDASKTKKRERGLRRFITRIELQASYVSGDCLTVECVLDVVESFLSETTAIDSPPPDLSRHLGALLLRTPVGADVTFTVQGEAFRAHRVVLAARSPVLKAKLSGGSAPAKEDDDASEVVAVDGMAPPVFRTLLHFIYTDALPDDLLGDLGREEHQELVRDLLAGADRYGMDRLKQICELVLDLREPLDAKTVAVALDPSWQHRHCQALGFGDDCVQFMPSA